MQLFKVSRGPCPPRKAQSKHEVWKESMRHTEVSSKFLDDKAREKTLEKTMRADTRCAGDGQLAQKNTEPQRSFERFGLIGGKRDESYLLTPC